MYIASNMNTELLSSQLLRNVKIYLYPYEQTHQRCTRTLTHTNISSCCCLENECTYVEAEQSKAKQNKIIIHIHVSDTHWQEIMRDSDNSLAKE